jgi:hypothetical protein
VTIPLPCYTPAPRDNPERAEALARAKTQMMYDRVRVPDNVDIERNLESSLADVRGPDFRELMDIARRIYKVEGAATLPPIPAICNSIEGARYRDYLAKLGATSTEQETDKLRAISFIVAYLYKEQPIDAEKLDFLVYYVHEKRQLLPQLDNWLQREFGSGVGNNWPEVLNGSLLGDVLQVEKPPPAIVIPRTLRNQHMMVCAASGHGKTVLFEDMIYADAESGAAVIVIDSQTDLINRLAVRIDPDRLVLIDPETCPPALNVFARPPESEADIGTTIELLEYAFSALDASLTSKQSVLYRFICRLMFMIPGATIHTMRELLEPDGTAPYQQYIDQMGQTARAFFAEYQRPRNNQYAETRQEVLRRLLTVLETKVFEDMLGASDMRLNIAEHIREGKVILISTAKRQLRQTGASLFGRLFIAQVMQAVMGRTERNPTYLYLDEFGTDYASDSPVVTTLFEQARKYNLGLVVAFQQLAQLPLKLASTIATNTAIKLAGGVSADDARALARQFRCEPEFIDATRRGTFAAWFRDMGIGYYTVDIQTLEQRPVLSRLADVQAQMREDFGPTSLPHPLPAKTPRNLENKPYTEQGREGKEFIVDD